MKKLILILFAMIAILACNGNCTKNCTNDVDTTIVDTTMIDTITLDSVY